MAEEKQKEEELLNFVTCGDIHPNVLGNKTFADSFFFLYFNFRAFLYLGGGGDSANLQKWRKPGKVPKLSGPG